MFGLFGNNSLRNKFLWSWFFSHLLFSFKAILASPFEILSTWGILYQIINVFTFFSTWHRILDKKILILWLIVTPIRILAWILYNDYIRGSLFCLLLLLYTWFHGLQYWGQLHYPPVEVARNDVLRDQGRIVYQRTSLYEAHSTYERKSTYDEIFAAAEFNAMPRRSTYPLLFEFSNHNSEEDEEMSETDEEDRTELDKVAESVGCSSDCVMTQLVNMILHSRSYSRKKGSTSSEHGFQISQNLATNFGAGDWSMSPGRKSSDEIVSSHSRPKYIIDYPDIFDKKY